ncbi:putative vacuolar protein sorting-associated protein TDA6 [Nematostella vectensis]|uniref:putative vacuolar protein sorting-associated protein TDA6 n=1 Tax=Nematostella vectensis TaxID=45351 RepID=UPI002077293D|nr:putative vacuolar protein sorting-associated protein TDA6 [Nematostella vectensis]
MRSALFLAILLVLIASAVSWRRRRRRRCAPQNCEVGSWTSWSHCNQACGQHGTQRRMRIKTKSESCGGKCSFVLVEMRSCNRLSCAGKTLKYRLEYVVKAWAPLVYLHKDEKFRPSDVDFFLSYVNMVNSRDKKTCKKTTLTSSNLCSGHKYDFLETKVPLSKPSATNGRVLFGITSSTVKAYAITKTTTNRYYDVYYWLFYPYNRGKRVCIGLKPKYIGCIGGYSTFGHHVGDWEHVTIRLNWNMEPLQFYASAHNFGTRYNYDKQIGVFRKGDREIKMHYSHPVLYSALGSHGMWDSPGGHTYKKLFNGERLRDYTSAGHKWYTWANLVVTPYGQWNGQAYFFRFSGRWGNKKRGCTLSEKFAGECILNSGPIGPAEKSTMSKDPIE